MSTTIKGFDKAEKATCRCEQVIYNTGDGWWHKDTGSEFCYQDHTDINSDTAEPRMEPWT